MNNTNGERPTVVIVKGKIYTLSWNGYVITRVTEIFDGEEKDLRYSEMPEEVKKLLC